MTQLKRFIRRATVADASGLERCMQAAYAIYSERLQGKRLPPMDCDYEKEILEFPTWVVEQDMSIIGGLTLVSSERYTSIANIGVHPDYQGQGIGGELMRFAEQVAIENNYSELRLATHVLLHENIALYAHSGWVETGRDDVRVYMSKTLKPEP